LDILSPMLIHAGLMIMLRLLSECLTQKEAGWIKPVRATDYGISKDWFCFFRIVLSVV
jgi:hypothetical protein